MIVPPNKSARVDVRPEILYPAAGGLLFVFTFLACTPGSVPVTPTVQATPLPSEWQIGPEGGVFLFTGNVLLSVPPNAVLEPTTVWLNDLDAVPAPYTGLSPLFVFGPEPLHFELPVQVGIPFGGSTEDARLFVSNGYGGYLQPAGIESIDDRLTLALQDLGTVFIAHSADVEEVSIATPPAAADVLIVLDHTPSMTDHRSTLARDLPNMMQTFLGSGIDIHLGVTDAASVSGIDRGKLLRLNDEGQSYRYLNATNNASLAAQLVQLSSSDSTVSRGRDLAYTLLETQRDIPRNNGFQREDASLHILFLSDQDDHSESLTLPEFRRWVELQRSPPFSTQVHAIASMTEPSCGSDGISDDYLSYPSWTDGAVGSICAPTYAYSLDQLATQATSTQRAFGLLHPANPETITVQGVYTDGSLFEPLPNEWSYEADLQGLVFTPSLAAGTEVHISYRPADNPLDLL